MTQWIAGITRGHNAGVCLLKNGEVVFAIEEERFSRMKYDGAPLLSILKIKEYTDKLDYLVVAHTQLLAESAAKLDYCGEDAYTSLARKLGLIRSDVNYNPETQTHPQVIDLGNIHHKLHAACAFYRSGFDKAVSVVVDGAGTFYSHSVDGRPMTLWETETVFNCSYPAKIESKYRHLGGNGLRPLLVETAFDNKQFDTSDESSCILIADSSAGIVKSYEAVTRYNGFDSIEAGKTMGLFPYGKENENLPDIFGKSNEFLPHYKQVNQEFITPTYPNGALVCDQLNKELATPIDIDRKDLVRLQNRKDLSYKVQKETQKQVLDLIRFAVNLTQIKNVALSGGYGLNCVANYYYLDELKDEGISLYVEPVSNDAGTAIGAALFWHHFTTGDTNIKPYAESLYLGPKYTYDINSIIDTADKYGGEVTEAKDEDIVGLITDKNIVALFQGRSESGPRALGNRSILYDPRDPDGKDHVNKIKRREFFRPFAGSMLQEHVHEWFDLRGMEETPHMMYAVNCQPGIEEKIPSIIHVDGTCRIQTVTEKQNENYYRLIKAFYDATGCPILFNTSFNLGGEPLVETLDDAVRTLANSGIEYLYLPEYGKLITVKND
jgi:carbamoyltransferase